MSKALIGFGRRSRLPFSRVAGFRAGQAEISHSRIKKRIFQVPDIAFPQVGRDVVQPEFFLVGYYSPVGLVRDLDKDRGRRIRYRFTSAAARLAAFLPVCFTKAGEDKDEHYRASDHIREWLDNSYNARFSGYYRRMPDYLSVSEIA